MTNKDIKLNFLTQLQQRGIWIKQISDDQYVTRCPFCGDSSDPTHGHFYIKLNLNNNKRMVYHCFKCPAGGSVTKDVCERLNIEDTSMLGDIEILNRTSDKEDKKKIMGESINIFNYKIPEIRLGPKTDYIKDRLLYPFTIDDYRNMKVITYLSDFVKENNIKALQCERNIAEMLDKYYVGFLSYGNSHILFRDITGKMKIPWIKFPITKKSEENRIFYSLSTDIDVFTKEDITINLCEGVMDAISICYNLEFNKPNTITIAVTGKYYEPILIYLIGIGLCGDNIHINVYADNDKKFNSKNKAGDTNLEFYQKLFRRFKYVFKDIKIYYNIVAKDCGYPKSMIVLKEYKI